MTYRMGYLLALCSVVGCVPTRTSSAQSLAERVGAVGDGAVTFHFTARPGVCGGEEFIRLGRNTFHGNWSSHRGVEPCETGPLQVRLSLENGVVHRLQYRVGAPRDRGARDLGAVRAVEAARYLMSLAERGSSRVSAKAIMPAVLADSAVVWPALLAIARDPERSRATRSDALFWLSRYAGGAIAGRPNQPLLEDDSERDDDDLKRHAVFVLSQLPRGEGIPQLVAVARSDASWSVRSHALFWLGQSGDRRAIEVFESVLR